jgi:hypothetical protein
VLQQPADDGFVAGYVLDTLRHLSCGDGRRAGHCADRCSNLHFDDLAVTGIL